MIDTGQENGCKICGKAPAESYRKIKRQGTVFTCSQCLQDASDIGAATKNHVERLFVKAAFIHEVWDAGNTRAKFLMELARCRLDPCLCIRMRDQVSDLMLRKRWLQARYDGITLPRVARAVRWHFEQEFHRLYPRGSVTSNTTMLKPTNTKGSPIQKWG